MPVHVLARNDDDSANIVDCWIGTKNATIRKSFFKNFKMILFFSASEKTWGEIYEQTAHKTARTAFATLKIILIFTEDSLM